ncbi:DUF4183 domain-containing protein [Paenibacillus thermotolerans]
MIRRYFYIAPSDIDLSEETVIFSNSFVDDAGEPVSELTDHGHNGYTNLYINGVLQEGKIYCVRPDAITLAATGQKISEGTPIILESVGFFAKLECK